MPQAPVLPVSEILILTEPKELLYTDSASKRTGAEDWKGDVPVQTTGIALGPGESLELLCDDESEAAMDAASEPIASISSPAAL